MGWILALLLAPLAVIVALAPLSDLLSFVASRRPRMRRAASRPRRAPRLLFLVPAHDEELLIRRCLESLEEEGYPLDRFETVVVADNCTDRTADVAREGGATVLERHDPLRRGKGYAIGWALERLEIDRFDAVIVIDADTLLEPEFATQVAARAPLRRVAYQCYDDLSNEFETWLTTLSGLLTRIRYDLALPLKQKAGLNVPLTGDGTVIGTRLLERIRWDPTKITEGWDLYVRYTLAGIPVGLIPGARLYAQEARSLDQASSQRSRWSRGRLDVLRRNFAQIVTSSRISFRQRLDLLAELLAQGPATQTAVGLVGLSLSVLLQPPGAALLAVLFALPLVQLALYLAIALGRHPRPALAFRAMARVPFYVAWRTWLQLRVLARRSGAFWSRTERHQEMKGAGIK